MTQCVEIIAVVLVVMGVVLNALWWSSAIKFDGAPDEYLHIKIPSFYVEYHRLPVFLKDPGMGLTCRKNGVDCGGSYSLYANYGYFVNAGTMALFGGTDYLKGRLGSVLMAGMFIFLVYMVTRKIFPGDSLVVWTVVLVAAAVPMFTFVSAYINSDIAGLVSNIMVLYFCWLLVNEKSIRMRLLVFGGFSVGLLALSRLNQYPMFLLVPWAVILRKHKYQEGWRSVIRVIEVVGIVGVVVSGWWFVRNWALYQDPIGNDTSWRFWWTFSTRLNPKQMGINPLELFFGHIYGRNWLWATFRSFIGSFGYMTIWYPPWFYKTVAGMVLLAGAGLVGGIRRLGGIRKGNQYKFMFWVGVGMVAVVTVLLSAWTSWANEFQPQGRYWFAFYYPLIVGLVFGIIHLFKGNTWRISSAIFLVGLFMMANIWGRQLIVAAGGGN
jgi:hypothetical protein